MIYQELLDLEDLKCRLFFRKTLVDNSQIKIVYVLLDGVGDLPHPDIKNMTPLQAAKNTKLGQN